MYCIGNQQLLRNQLRNAQMCLAVPSLHPLHQQQDILHVRSLNSSEIYQGSRIQQLHAVRSIWSTRSIGHYCYHSIIGTYNRSKYIIVEIYLGFWLCKHLYNYFCNYRKKYVHLMFCQFYAYKLISRSNFAKFCKFCKFCN